MFDILKTFKCNLFRMKQKYVGGGREELVHLNISFSVLNISSISGAIHTRFPPTVCTKTGWFPLTHKVNCIINHLP